MGTRSLTYFFEDGKPFAAFYRQMDGYPEGHGADLGKILAGLTLVNGYQSGQEAGKFANGPGCLAAQVVAELKAEHGIGGIYLINPNPDANKEGWQEYEYHVHINRVGVSFDAKFESYVECRDPERVVFSGTFAEFYKWAQKPKRNDDGYIPVLKNKPKAKPVYDTLRDALQHEVVSVRFTKADGCVRDMECTTDMARIPEDKHPTLATIDAQRDRNLYKVFDLEKQEWRAFRNERLLDWGVY
jgi:hypothetical protein